MSNPTTELLDLWKARHGIENDSQAAVALGLRRQAISNWRQRGSQGEPATIAKMARDIGQEPAIWLAKAEGSKSKADADKKAWAAVVKKLSGMGLAIWGFLWISI